MKKIEDISQLKQGDKIVHFYGNNVEFFEYLIKKAAKDLHQNIEIEIESPAGHKMRMKAVTGEESQFSADDDIFNHLDDVAAVNAFIRANSTRR